MVSVPVDFVLGAQNGPFDESGFINHRYYLQKGWGIWVFDDRLDLDQIGLLLGMSGRHSNNYTITSLNPREISEIRSDPREIAMFFFYHVAVNACMFDVPNSFLLTVIEGDLTLVSIEKDRLRRLFGSEEMREPDWQQIDSMNLRTDIAAKLRKYRS